MIAISNPAGTLCATDSIRPVPGPFLPLRRLIRVAAFFPTLAAPDHVNELRARKVGGIDEDNRNGHLLREETGDKGRNLAGRHRDIESISRNYPNRRRLSFTQRASLLAFLIKVHIITVNNFSTSFLFLQLNLKKIYIPMLKISLYFFIFQFMHHNYWKIKNK